MDPSDLEPGFYRATKNRRTYYGSSPAETPPAYFQVTESRRVVLVYPSGEVARNDAAIILLRSDILPVCEVEEVPREETPFEDEVQPRPDEGPDPVQPVE